MKISTPPQAINQAILEYYEVATMVNEELKAKREISDVLIRAMALRACMVLRAYCLPENWPDRDRGHEAGSPLVPLPLQLAEDVARHIYMLANGHIPQWMLHLQKTGSATADPRMQQNIGLALAYKSLCEAGRIRNTKPVKTISDAYGVSRRAVQQWAKQYPTDPSLWFPQALTEEERAQMILAEMPIAAGRYREWGRAPKNARPFGKVSRRLRAK
jgi:hypothetical protein